MCLDRGSILIFASPVSRRNPKKPFCARTRNLSSLCVPGIVYLLWAPLQSVYWIHTCPKWRSSSESIDACLCILCSVPFQDLKPIKHKTQVSNTILSSAYCILTLRQLITEYSPLIEIPCHTIIRSGPQERVLVTRCQFNIVNGIGVPHPASSS